MIKNSKEAKALISLREARPNIHYKLFDVVSTKKGDATWRDSLTKFHAFALTDWTRVLAFDSDTLVLNGMDHYFPAPMAPVAVPRAYWLNEKDTDVVKQILGSHAILIESQKERYRQILEEALLSAILTCWSSTGCSRARP